MHSDAATVPDYLASLPDDRREALSTVRQAILDNLPEGYEEAMRWGMITYEVPLSVRPDTYNGQPLMYAALASQKRHMSVYLTAVYGSEEAAAAFREAYRATGKRLDMGKSCVRFRKLADLPVELIAQSIASVPLADFLEMNEAVRSKRKRR